MRKDRIKFPFFFTSQSNSTYSKTKNDVGPLVRTMKNKDQVNFMKLMKTREESGKSFAFVFHFFLVFIFIDVPLDEGAHLILFSCVYLSTDLIF